MRRAPWAVALVAGLVLTGCGIPDATDVQPLRPGPSTGVSSGDDTAPTRSLRSETEDRSEFVLNYLEAAAGDFEKAAERVKEFLTPNEAVTFKATSDIRVVRLTEPPLVEPGQEDVRINVQGVGTLGAKGVLQPTSGGPETYNLKLREVEGQQGLFVSKPPGVLLLSVEALEKFYEQRTIYFWNSDRTGLVPDVRYMWRGVPDEQQPTEIIDWLTTGPSPLIAPVVEALRAGTKPIGNVPAVKDDTLQISLSGQAVPTDDPTAEDRLQRQLRWSLRPDLPGALQLSVEQRDTRVYTGADYLSSNPAYRQIAEPERFAVYGGQVRRLARSYNAAQPVPVIAPEANRAVVQAALSASGSRSWAALVTTGSRGRTTLRVGAAGPGEHAALRPVAGLPVRMGRPVWAKSPVGADTGTVGLVPADGRLYWFGPDGAPATPVSWPGGPRKITAVAVAADAHRIAVLADGKLFVAGLSINEDGPQMTQPWAIRTLLTDLTAVDWSSEGTLVVAGKRAASGRVAIMEVSIDGATQTDRLSDLGSSPVTHLSSLPAGPTGGESGSIAYVLGGAAYDEINPNKISVDDLAEPVADPPADVQPLAPFFLT